MENKDDIYVLVGDNYPADKLADDNEPKCVICHENQTADRKMTALSCCVSSHLHEDCLNTFISNNDTDNLKCPLCRAYIDITENKIYEIKDYECHYCLNKMIILHYIISIVRLLCYIYTLYLLGKIYEKGWYTFGVVTIHTLSSFLPSGVIFLSRIFDIECFYTKISKKITKPDIINILSKTVTLHGISMSPDNSTMYFKPIGLKCCLSEYEITEKNWIKIYFKFMFIYVFSQAFCELLYAVIAYFKYITFEIHIILQLVTWFIFAVPCAFSGDNYGRKMDFETVKIRSVHTRTGTYTFTDE